MATYIAFVFGLTIGAGVALLVLSLMVVGSRSENALNRDHYFAVLDLIERERRTLSRRPGAPSIVCTRRCSAWRSLCRRLRGSKRFRTEPIDMPAYFAFLLWQYMASALLFGRPGPSRIREEKADE